MNPTRQDLEYDPILSNVAVDYQNEDYVAEQICPVVTVAKRTGKYYKYKKDKFRPVDSLRGMGAKTNEVGHRMSQSSPYSVDEHALKELVPDELKEIMPSAFDAEADGVENVTERLLVEKEQALATYMQNTGNIGNNTTLAGDNQWDSYSTSDPFDDIETAKQTIHAAIFKDPNVLFMGKQTYDELKHHPDLLERVKYSERGVMTRELMQELFDVDRVIIGAAGYNSATEGQSDSMSYIWGKYAWLLYVTPRPGMKQVSFAYHFQLRAPRRVDKWRGSEGTDRKGTFVRVTDEYTREVVTTDCAYLIKNAVS